MSQPKKLRIANLATSACSGGQQLLGLPVEVLWMILLLLEGTWEDTALCGAISQYLFGHSITGPSLARMEQTCRVVRQLIVSSAFPWKNLYFALISGLEGRSQYRIARTLPSRIATGISALESLSKSDWKVSKPPLIIQFQFLINLSVDPGTM